MLFFEWLITNTTSGRTVKVEAFEQQDAADVYAAEHPTEVCTVVIGRIDRASGSRLFAIEGASAVPLCANCDERPATYDALGLDGLPWCEDCAVREERAEREHQAAHMPGRF